MSGHPFRERPETIWKYPLEAPGEIREHQIPRGAPIVHVGADPGGDGIALWARVTSQQTPRVTRRFVFVGTGDDAPAGSTYLGSAIATHAWHVFEL